MISDSTLPQSSGPGPFADPKGDDAALLDRLPHPQANLDAQDRRPITRSETQRSPSSAAASVTSTTSTRPLSSWVDPNTSPGTGCDVGTGTGAAQANYSFPDPIALASSRPPPQSQSHPFSTSASAGTGAPTAPPAAPPFIGSGPRPSPFFPRPFPLPTATSTSTPSSTPTPATGAANSAPQNLLHQLHHRRAESTNTTAATPGAATASTLAQDDSYSSASSTDPRNIADPSASRWTPEKERIIQMPYRYLLDRPGKDFRSQLVSAFNLWLQVPPSSLKTISRLVGMLHTASLLVDDVEDSSILRRGVPAAHTIFGTAQTINSANYVYFMALQEVCKLSAGGRDRAIAIFTDEMINLHRGQGMDLYWRDTLTCPTEDDYLEMVGNKTGGLFRLAVRLMQAESELDVDCTELVSVMGMLFQVMDDYLNLCSTNYAARKGLCEDLTEGKFSFPIIHAIRSNPQDLVLISILRQRTHSDEVKQFAVEHMRKAGSFEYSVQVMRVLRDRAHGLVDEIVRRLNQLEEERARGGRSEGEGEDMNGTKEPDEESDGEAGDCENRDQTAAAESMSGDVKTESAHQERQDRIRMGEAAVRQIIDRMLATV